jgi:RimJ/RimL family protein N-acetyltransferase
VTTDPQILLRAVERADLAFTRSCRNDPAINALTLGRRFPITEVGEQRWFEGLGTGSFPTEATFTITDATNEPLGLVSLSDIDWLNRTAWFGIWLGPQQQGRGVGLQATRLLVAYAADRLSLRRLKLHVLADHAAAIRIYEQAGFREEGRLVGEVLDGGVARDVSLMACPLSPSGDPG